RPSPFRGGIGSRSPPIRPARRLALAEIGLLPITLPVVSRPDTVNSGGPCDRGRVRLVENHDRSLAFRRLLDRLPQHAPVNADRLVRGAEVLLRAVLDGAHRFARPL